MLDAFRCSRQQLDPAVWDDFVCRSPQDSLYARWWYLCAAAEHWEAIVVTHRGSGEWLGVWPFALGQKYGICYALQPPFCQHWGPLLAPLAGESHRRARLTERIAECLLATLPHGLRLASYNFSPHFNCFWPFLRAGFTVTPRLNLLLSLEGSAATWEAQFSSSVRNHLKKAARNGLFCRLATDPDKLWLLCRLMGHVPSRAAADCGRRVWEAAYTRGQAFFLETVDAAGAVHSRGAFMHQGGRAIFMASSLSPEHRHAGGNTMLLAHAMRHCQILGLRCLDLKGSMLPGVAHYFWGFNPRQELYHNFTLDRLTTLQRAGYRALATRPIRYGT